MGGTTNVQELLSVTSRTTFFVTPFRDLNCKSAGPSARPPRPCHEITTSTTTKTNQIGQCLCNILLGFGVKLLCVEEFGPVEDLVQRGAKFVEIDEARNRSSGIARQRFLAAPCPPRFAPRLLSFYPTPRDTCHMPCRNLSC